MQLYPLIKKSIEPKILIETMFDMLSFIGRARKDDVQAWNNLPQSFVSGRKVGRVPSSSADVLVTDRLGDINWTTSFIYILVDNSGTPVWRRATLASW